MDIRPCDLLWLNQVTYLWLIDHQNMNLWICRPCRMGSPWGVCQRSGWGGKNAMKQTHVFQATVQWFSSRRESLCRAAKVSVVILLPSSGKESNCKQRRAQTKILNVIQYLFVSKNRTPGKSVQLHMGTLIKNKPHLQIPARIQKKTWSMSFLYIFIKHLY